MQETPTRSAVNWAGIARAPLRSSKWVVALVDAHPCRQTEVMTLCADGFVTLGPAFKLGDAYKYAPADADHAQVAEDVSLEMVSADA